MTKTEILAELPKLSPEELAKLDELVGETWCDEGNLTDADKSALDARLAEYKKNPNAGSTWEEVMARIEAKLHP
jgi:putative addiction module component (TIGR02574 family)